MNGSHGTARTASREQQQKRQRTNEDEATVPIDLRVQQLLEKHGENENGAVGAYAVTQLGMCPRCVLFFSLFLGMV